MCKLSLLIIALIISGSANAGYGWRTDIGHSENRLNDKIHKLELKLKALNDKLERHELMSSSNPIPLVLKKASNKTK